MTGSILSTTSFFFWHPERKEKVRLDYKHLHSGVVYRIEATLEGHQQGPGISASGGYKKVQRYTEAIRP
jgi:hypothetical protein